MPLSRGSCRLRFLRKRKKWTQAYLAKITGYHPRMISHYENDEKPMSVNVMMNISAALNCRMEDLYEWEIVGDSE